MRKQEREREGERLGEVWQLTGYVEAIIAIMMFLRWTRSDQQNLNKNLPMFYTCQVDCRNMVNYLLLSAILGNYLEGPLVQIKADKTKSIIKAATFRGHGGSSKTPWAEKL